MEFYTNAGNSQKAAHVNGSRDGAHGLRPSVRALLGSIDTSDPAWPATAAVLQEMADAGVDLDETVIAVAVKVGAYRFATAKTGRRSIYQQVTLDTASDSIVYYIRRAGLIKIGYTADPMQRFRDLLPDKILAFEPGAEEQEILRHRQFEHLRAHGEYFRSTPELLEHIRQIRRLHGTPDPAWPSLARQQRELLPSPGSRETVTTAEARHRFRLKDSQIRGWLRYGKLSRAGKNDDGLNLYYVQDLTALCSAEALRPLRPGRRTPGT